MISTLILKHQALAGDGHFGFKCLYLRSPSHWRRVTWRMWYLYESSFSVVVPWKRRLNGHDFSGYRKKYERDFEANRLWRKFNTSWSGEFEKMDLFNGRHSFRLLGWFLTRFLEHALQRRPSGMSSYGWKIKKRKIPTCPVVLPICVDFIRCLNNIHSALPLSRDICGCWTRLASLSFKSKSPGPRRLQ